MYIICMLIAFLACVLGKICGMGGGVIIKPVLDALGIATVNAINFLSGCTVLGMSLWSVGKAWVKRDSQIDFKISTPLALGAALGGILGKSLYACLTAALPNAESAGGIQAGLLLLATTATLLYTIKKDRVFSCHIYNPLACVTIGLALGMLGSFLGIGGGPFNMAVLYFFFSMSTKTAAQNSLYIILISQATGLIRTLLSGGMPQVTPVLLAGMVLCGVLGSEIGGRLNRRLSESATTRLFEGAMALVMAICLYNLFKFL